MGRAPALSNQLTEMQAEYVRLRLAGTPRMLAAEKAGYANHDHAPSFLERNPTVQAAIVAGVRTFLMTQAGPEALQLMYEFMVDPTRDSKLRLACAKTLADRSGYIAPKAKDASPLDAKSLVDMSAAEMREMASRIQKELSDRAVTIIDSVPDMARNDTQDIDLLE